MKKVLYGVLFTLLIVFILLLFLKGFTVPDSGSSSIRDEKKQEAVTVSSGNDSALVLEPEVNKLVVEKLNSPVAPVSYSERVIEKTILERNYLEQRLKDRVKLINPVGNGDLYPLYKDESQLGSTENRWRSIYLRNTDIDPNGNITTAGSVDIHTNLNVDGNIVFDGTITGAVLNTANNGLHLNGLQAVQLGGTLIENTTVDLGNYNLEFGLGGTGDFNITDSLSNSLLYVDSAGAIGVGTTNPLYDFEVDGDFYAHRTITSYDNILTVDRNGGGDYTTISDAISAINTAGDNTSTNPYSIWVMAGTYTETFTLPNFTALKGQGYYSTIIDGVVTVSSGNHVENLRISAPTGQTTAVIAAPSSDTSYITNTYILINGTNAGPLYGVRFTGSTDMRIYATFIYVRNTSTDAAARAVVLKHEGTSGDLEVHRTHMKTSQAGPSKSILAWNSASASNSDIIASGSWSAFNDITPIGADNDNASGQIKLAIEFENDAADHTLYSVQGAGVVNEPRKMGNTAVDLDAGFTTGTGLNMSWQASTTLTGTLSGVNLDFTNVTANGTNYLYGLNINQPAATTLSTEYGIYQQGTGWDLGARFDDDVEVRSTLTIGNKTGVNIGTHDYDSLLIYNQDTQTSGYIFNVHSSQDVSATTNSSAWYLGGFFNPNVSNNYNYTGRVIGVQAQVDHYGTGTVSTARSVVANTRNLSSGTVAEATGGRFSILNSGSGTINTAYGVYISTPTNSGTIGTSYGLYLADQSVGSTRFAIYSVGGTNYLGGNVGIGTTAPASKLEVSGGDIRVTGGSFIDDGTTLTVPDYVFEPDYDLMSISDLRAYLEEHKHLPNVPDMNDTLGWARLSLQDRDMRLLEKTEENTLYILENDDRISNIESILKVRGLLDDSSVVDETSESTSSEFSNTSNVPALVALESAISTATDFLRSLAMESIDGELVLKGDLNIVGDISAKSGDFLDLLSIGLVQIDASENAILLQGAPCVGSSEVGASEDLIDTTLCSTQTLYLQKTLSGNIDMFNGKVVIDPLGNTSLAGNLTVSGDAVIAGSLTAKKDFTVEENLFLPSISGHAKISKDDTQVWVECDALTSESKIIITPTAELERPLYVKDIVEDEKKFLVKYSGDAQDTDIGFDWLVLN